MIFYKDNYLLKTILDVSFEIFQKFEVFEMGIDVVIPKNFGMVGREFSFQSFVIGIGIPDFDPIYLRGTTTLLTFPEISHYTFITSISISLLHDRVSCATSIFLLNRVLTCRLDVLYSNPNDIIILCVCVCVKFSFSSSLDYRF